MRKGFSTESAAKKFAEQVGGEVEFSPLPDYMDMIPYWVVEWKGDSDDQK